MPDELPPLEHLDGTIVEGIPTVAFHPFSIHTPVVCTMLASQAKPVCKSAELGVQGKFGQIYIYVRNQWGNLGKDAVCVFAMFDEADSWSHMQNIASWILLLTEDHVSKLVVCFARSQPRPVRGGCEGGDPKGQ